MSAKDRASRLVISTTDLRDILERHPQIEMELAAMAAEKIAEEVMQKIKKIDVQSMAEHGVKEAETRIRQYGVQEPLKQELGRAAYKALEEVAKVHLQRMINEAITKHVTERHEEIKRWMGEAIIKYSDGLFKDLDRRVNEKIDQQIIAVIRSVANGGNNTVRGPLPTEEGRT